MWMSRKVREVSNTKVEEKRGVGIYSIVNFAFKKLDINIYIYIYIYLFIYLFISNSHSLPSTFYYSTTLRFSRSTHNERKLMIY